MTRDRLRQAFELHKDAVYRFAWRMTNSAEAAEDAAQEAFLALARGGFDPARGEVRAFLFGTARNQVRKRWRDSQRWVDLEDAFVAPEFDPERTGTAEAVAAAVAALPSLQREALILSEYEDLSLEEIAASLGSEVGTIKSRLFRARENLRRALAPLKKDAYGTAK